MSRADEFTEYVCEQDQGLSEFKQAEEAEVGDEDTDCQIVHPLLSSQSRVCAWPHVHASPHTSAGLHVSAGAQSSTTPHESARPSVLVQQKTYAGIQFYDEFQMHSELQKSVGRHFSSVSLPTLKDKSQSFFTDEDTRPAPDGDAIDGDVADSIDDTGQRYSCVDNARQVSTAKEFVESVIQKAILFMFDSKIEHENNSILDNVFEPSNETRSMVVVSSHMSNSLTSLSTPPKASPLTRHPLLKSEIILIIESTTNSESENESDELITAPVSSAEYSVNESNNSIITNTAGEDEKRLQMVAIDITAKALQDAIKIFTEGSNSNLVVCSNNIHSNSVELFQSWPCRTTEDMITTTYSSSREREISTHPTSSWLSSNVPKSLAFHKAEVCSQDPVETSGQILSIDDCTNLTSQVQLNVKDEAVQADCPPYTVISGIDRCPLQRLGYCNQHTSSDTNTRNNPCHTQTPPSLSSSIEDISPCPDRPIIIIVSPGSPPYTNESIEDDLSDETK